MVEQKQEHKRAKAIRRILKWLCTGWLAFLLILALVFQAPWKISVLLAVFFAACGLLSRTALQWFLLAIAAVLIAIVVWIFLPDGEDIWLPFTLTEELAAHEAAYAIPKEQNAAIIYNRLLQNYVPDEWRIRFLSKEAFDKTLSEPWLSRDYPALAKWVDRHQDIITALPEACRIKTCRFPSEFGISGIDATLVHRYSALKSWALALLLSANNDVAEGRTDEGLIKYIDALQIAKHLYQQKRIHDFLIGFGIEGIALPRINRFIIESHISEKQLQQITEALGNIENNWSEDFSQCFEYDRLFVKNAFCSLVYQSDPKGHIRFSRDPAATAWGPHRPRSPTDGYWQKKSMKAYTTVAWFFFPSTPQRAVEMIDVVFEQYRPVAEPDFARHKKDSAPAGFYSLNCNFLVRLFINRTVLQYDGFREIYPKRLLHRRGTRILIALKQYRINNGGWPENLDAIRASMPDEALIDPQNDGFFVYESTDENFTLYSKGKNGTDDGGRKGATLVSDPNLPPAAEDDIRFWPPKKSKE